jgi:4-amino-4-deoxy-L-arabinose transferase-like glycosyltransferase
LTPLTGLVLALTAVRLVVAATVPLAPDEAYYWVWSHALAASYLDHPPMVALWIRAGTLLAGQTPFAVRLLGPLSAAVASWFVFDAARHLFPGRPAGVAAVSLLNGTLLLGVGSVIMTPDTPLLFFWTATLWAMVRLIDSDAGVWWLAAGLLGGLALDSKYTALFLWIGIGLWVLVVPATRPWLRRWQPWAAVALGALLFAPVVAWNASHGWAGFARQGARVGDWRPLRAVGFLAELIGGQVGLVTPWIWVLCMIGLIVAIRRTCTHQELRWSLLAALSAPPLLVFIQHAIGDRVQGNWPAVIYPALVLAAAGLIRPGRHNWRNNWIAASAVGFSITALVYFQALTGLIPLPPGLDPITLRLAGWDELARRVEATRQQAGAEYVAVDGYTTASELAWWLPPGTAVVATDDHWALTDLPQPTVAGTRGLLVRDARRTDPPDPAIWTRLEPLGSVSRPGSPAAFTLYLSTASTMPAGAVALPHRR